MTITEELKQRLTPAPETVLEARRWPTCQKCGQSATGKYNGRFGCCRDGWTGK